MSLAVQSPDREPSSFPRVSGDEPWIGQAWAERIPFSPRERG